MSPRPAGLESPHRRPSWAWELRGTSGGYTLGAGAGGRRADRGRKEKEGKNEIRRACKRTYFVSVKVESLENGCLRQGIPSEELEDKSAPHRPIQGAGKEDRLVGPGAVDAAPADGGARVASREGAQVLGRGVAQGAQTLTASPG